MPQADARTGGTYLARAADFNRQSGGSTQEIQSVRDGMMWHAMASVCANEFCVLHVFSLPTAEATSLRTRYGGVSVEPFAATNIINGEYHAHPCLKM